ncbi:BglG family transcription antiterminator LicT [Breznakia pachnodae]|uniref:Beta-glucoside operon transcriptional antiterminator n=1 Tax=Breznakia pachnodae TaxID=265178 RepID=A0ABU0E4D9_9FIRM|nr:PRD domain-containing protein [Breznakia pachnodae]MDQ0361768.1 beta-glucoside operon transcriptional antiterminator [Breznakia pachnodae]
MKIFKILNNNVVTVIENKQEKVIMGRGIAFRADVGDVIDETKIQKIFLLSNYSDADRIISLLQTIPLEYLQLADAILKEAKASLDIDADIIFISLSDHIKGIVDRARKGIQLRNPLLPDIRRFYIKEFEFGLEAVNMINQTFDVQLTEDEAAFIALHLLTNTEDKETSEDIAYQMTEIIHEIIQVVSDFYQQQYNENSVNYYRFIMHLRLFAQRLLAHQTYSSADEDELLVALKRKYQKAYQCAEKVREFIKKKYAYDITDEELLYLTIHINRLNQN